MVVVHAGRTRVAVCSWATQVSDGHLLLRIGPQSETGAWLVEGRAFSLNVLLREQLDLARRAGVAGDVVTRVRATKTMTCRVLRSLDVAPDGAPRGILDGIVSTPQEPDGEPILQDHVFRILSSAT